MGDGVANILGLLSILLTENNKLFLIEELENDIHPSALKKLLNVILDKSRNNQFIISTHSNIVLKYLATASNAKVFYTDSTKSVGDSVRVPTCLIREVENNQNNRIQILGKLGYDLFDFDLYKGYLVFEESSAEQIVREFLIPQFVPALHQKIKTIGGKGSTTIEAYFDDFLRLFVYINGNTVYKNKAWVIADGDDAGTNATDALKKRFSDWPPSNFKNFSKANFELYYPPIFQQQFEEIQKITSKESKRNAKGALTREVMAWICENKDQACEQFAISASEVIMILDEINTILSKPNTTT